MWAIVNVNEIFLHLLMYLSIVEDVAELNLMLYSHLKIVDQMFVIVVELYLMFVQWLLVHLKLNVVLHLVELILSNKRNI